MKFSSSHEWAKWQDGTAYIGITDHAKEEIGEITYIELPSVGRELQAGEEAVIVESTKAAADIYTPLSGRVTSINEQLMQNPQLIYEGGEDSWLFTLQDIDENEYQELLTKEEYQSLLS